MRDERPVRRRGGCQKYKEGTLCAPRRATATCTRRPRRATRRASARPRSAPLRAVRLQRQRLLQRLHVRPELRRAPTSATATRAARRCAAPRARQAGECQTDFCAQGVCCDTACATRAARARCRRAGHVHPGPERASDPAACARHGAGGLRHERQVPGGRLPEVSAGHGVQESRPAPRTTTFTPGVLRRRGRASTPPGELVLPVPVRQRRLQGDLHVGRRLRGARPCAPAARAA